MSQVMLEAMHDMNKNSDAGSQLGAGLVAAIGPAMINNVVDSLLTPSGISALISTQEGSQAKGKANLDFAKFANGFAFLSPTRFRLTDRDGISVVMALEDWTWKITEIRVSADVLKRRMNSSGSNLRTGSGPAPDVSIAKLSTIDGAYLAEISLLATDLERMFQETMDERAGVDLSPPGALETEIGKFVQRRVAIRDSTGRNCASVVLKAGEDPIRSYGATVVLRFKCEKIGGKLVYDASKFLSAHGTKSKQLIVITRGLKTTEATLIPETPLLNIAQPL
jgi:hypothetical protein